MKNKDKIHQYEKTGMTVSANLYFPISKGIKSLDDAIKRLNPELDIR